MNHHDIKLCSCGTQSYSLDVISIYTYKPFWSVLFVAYLIVLHKLVCTYIQGLPACQCVRQKNVKALLEIQYVYILYTIQFIARQKPQQWHGGANSTSECSCTFRRVVSDTGVACLITYVGAAMVSSVLSPQGLQEDQYSFIQNDRQYLQQQDLRAGQQLPYICSYVCKGCIPLRAKAAVCTGNIPVLFKMHKTWSDNGNQMRSFMVSWTEKWRII